MTTHIRGDVPMKVKLTAFTDRTFKFKIKPPETSWFLKKATGK
jgi:large subunit ribosomal protein L11